MGLLILEFLVLGHRVASFFCSVQAPVGSPQLVPGLFSDLRVGIDLDGAFEVNGGGSVIAQQHLSPAQIVVQVHEPRFLPLCRFNQLFSFCSVAFLDFDCP